ncbi:MAG: proline--tRNA ligase [Bacteriovoracaceae bacterium]
MRLSKGFWQTYKEIPSEAEIISHQLMLRAGLIFKSASGLYEQLPMGLRVVKKVEKIIREELDKANCNEILMTVATPSEYWKETGRWDSMGPLMLKIQDRAGRELCFSPTNEESVTNIFRKTVKSYKQMPVTLYQINTKFRDEIRPRFGLMRCREFIMKDAYSFHVDKKCLDEVYQQLYTAYENIFNRLGLEFIAVEADGGAMAAGGAKTHEFQVIANSGEDKIIYCVDCKYAANLEKAQTIRVKQPLNNSKDAIKKVDTPNKASCADVAEFLKLPIDQTLKSLVYTSIVGSKEEHYLILLVGDDELNEIKLKNHLNSDHLKQSSEGVLNDFGLVKGYIGPINLHQELKILVDSEIDLNAAYITGAQEKDKHLANFIISRDLKNFKQVDLRISKEGDNCCKCGKSVVLKKGIEVGHVFQLGDKYTKSMKVTVLDPQGKAITPLMGCYGIGVTRVVAAAIEQHFDEHGIIWPTAIAPYQVYLGYIAKTPEVKKIANDLYSDLQKKNIEVLFDDRELGPGFMFKDADLLGLPLCVMVGEREYLKTGMIEVKIRKTGEKLFIKPEELMDFITKNIGA